MLRYLLCFFILAALASPIWSEQYWIADEQYKIDGRTKPEALIQIIGPPEKKVFLSREELQNYVSQRKQRIDNLRTFQQFDITLDYARPLEIDTGQNIIPVILTVHIKDGARILPLPYALYNSNAGFMAGAVVILPNIAGLLQDFQITGVYNAYPDENNELQWLNPNFELILDWTGLRAGDFKFGALGLVSKLNERIIDRGKTYLLAKSLLVTGLIRGSYQFNDTLTNTVEIIANGIPQTETIEIIDSSYYSYGQQKLSLQFTNTLTYDNINWIGNFRRGIESNLSLSTNYFMPYYADNWASVFVGADIAGHYILNSFINPNARFSFFYFGPDRPLFIMGEKVRGIINTELTGNFGVFINTGAQIKLLRIGKTEFHLTPTLDFAFVYAADGHPDPAETGFAAGAELGLMDDRLRAFPIRFGFAYDLRPKYGSDIGRRVEIDINFQMFY